MESGTPPRDEPIPDAADPRPLGRVFAGYLAGDGLASVLHLVTQAWLLRALDPVSFGSLALAQGVALWLVPLVVMAMGESPMWCLAPRGGGPGPRDDPDGGRSPCR